MSFEISAADFGSIVRSLRSDNQIRKSSDKRQTPRVGLSGRVTIIPCSTRAKRNAVTAMVRDLSTTGIGLAHSTPVRAGEQIIVRFSATHKEPAKAILCLVTHSLTVGDGLFTTGAKFLKDIEIAPTGPAVPPAPDTPAPETPALETPTAETPAPDAPAKPAKKPR